MTIVIARIKQGGKWLFAALAFVGVAIWAYFRIRRPALVHSPDPIDLALQRWDRITRVADARYVVEVAAARTTLKVEQARLLDLLRNTDEDAQIDRLIAEAARLKGE